MILVNSGAFLSISSWFCELTELIFVMIPYIYSNGYPPTTQGIMGHVQVANITNLGASREGGGDGGGGAVTGGKQLGGGQLRACKFIYL